MIFDKVVVAVTRNPDKDALFEVKERVEIVSAGALLEKIKPPEKQVLLVLKN
jgi:phosphopantetheine adenylyltransferase